MHVFLTLPSLRSLITNSSFAPGRFSLGGQMIFLTPMKAISCKDFFFVFATIRLLWTFSKIQAHLPQHITNDFTLCKIRKFSSSRTERSWIHFFGDGSSKVVRHGLFSYTYFYLTSKYVHLKSLLHMSRK